MKIDFKQIFNDYIGWIVLILIIFPLGILLDIKFLQTIRKINKQV